MKNKHIFEVVTKVIKPLLKNQEEYFVALLENWANIVPKAWQHSVYPIKLKWLDSGKAVLVLHSNNSATTIQLSFDSPMVINQLNAFLGHKVITKIVFNHH